MSKGVPSPRNALRGKAGPATSAVLARMLDSEGFSDHVANQVQGYWQRANTEKDVVEVERLRRGISHLTAAMSEADRKLLGQFIGLHMKMGFDAGLRMGLAVRLVREPDTARQHFDPASDHKLATFSDSPDEGKR